MSHAVTASVESVFVFAATVCHVRLNVDGSLAYRFAKVAQNMRLNKIGRIGRSERNSQSLVGHRKPTLTKDIIIQKGSLTL